MPFSRGTICSPNGVSVYSTCKGFGRITTRSSSPSLSSSRSAAVMDCLLLPGNARKNWLNRTGPCVASTMMFGFHLPDTLRSNRSAGQSGPSSDVVNFS